MNEIIERLKAIKALADKGVEGEAKAAALMYEKLIKKYNLTEADIMEEVKELEKFKYSDATDEILLQQIIYSVCGDIDMYETRWNSNGHKKKTIGAYVTFGEKIQIEYMHSIYAPQLQRSLKLCVSAFILANNIYPPPEKARKDSQTTRSKAEVMEVVQMSQGINKTNINMAIEARRYKND